MKVTIRGKKHTFNMSVVGKMDKKEFEKHCLELPLFIQLPEKERKLKIKESYGELSGNAKKSSKSKFRSDIHKNNGRSDRGDTRPEQSADDGGKDIEGKEDKAEIRNETIRSEKEETKL